MPGPPQSPIVSAAELRAAPNPARRFRLLEQVRRGLKVRHYSRRTEIAYCGWIRRFVLFHSCRHPSMMGEEEIAAFLNHLATDGGVSASTQNQALHSILFLYRQILKRDIGLVPGLTPAKRGHRLPVVLSVSEVRAVLSEMRGVPRLCDSHVWERSETVGVHEPSDQGYRFRSPRDNGVWRKGRQGSARANATVGLAGAHDSG